jgi:pectate lyase
MLHIVVLTRAALAGVPAFPGAEGFGTQTPGGRGGRVIEVTSLDDSGPGSLRAALEAEGARTVVFRVGGSVALKTPIVIRSPFVTVAGQTAPGDGILIRDTNLRVKTHDVVIRYVRCRIGGNRGVPSNRQDGIAIENDEGKKDTYNVVLDHCSVSWSQDENFGVSGVRDVTIQWCIGAEGLRRGYHDKGDHSMGMILGNYCDRISVHHNLLMSNGSRNPRIQGGLHDVVNNVVYNFGGIMAMFSRGPEVNMVGNWYQAGPSSSKRPPPVIRVEPGQDGGRYFLRGNINLVRRSNEQPEWLGMTDLPIAQVVVREPFKTGPITTMDAKTALEAVLKGAGATFPRRDGVDERLLREFREGRGQLIDHPDEVGGFPVIKGGDAPPDADHDGIPDAWEKKHGLNPGDPGDGGVDRDGDGYTNVEEYLNQLAASP